VPFKNGKSKSMPPLEELRSVLEYDQETGVFVWKKRGYGRTVGKVAGSKDIAGYLRIAINGERFKSHRLAWFYVHGFDPGDLVIDHIDGDPSNNRIHNLRLATNAQNGMNSKVNSNSKTGEKNVCWDNEQQKWLVQVCGLDGKRYKERFRIFEQACERSFELRKLVHGEYARHN